MSVNKVILVGNLGSDPETRTTQGGTVVANLRIATSERRKKGESWEDHTEWHRVVLFGKSAENAAKYLKKGRQVYIEGSLRATQYDKDGEKRYSTEIVASDVKFLGGGAGNNGGSDRGTGRQPADTRPDPSPGTVDDDIPF